MSLLLRAAAAMVVVAFAAEPCSMSFLPRIWTKRAGSVSELFAFEKNGRVGFIDRTGRIVIPASIPARIGEVGDFEDGLARVGNRYIDQTGRWAIQRTTWSAEDFSEGLARISVKSLTEKFGYDGKLIDTAGRIVAEIPAYGVGEFREGLASYEAKGKPGIRKFEPGNFVYLDFPGLQGFIGRDGKVAIEATFAEVGVFVGGLARATVDGYCHRVLSEGWKQGTPTTGYPSDCGGAPSDAVTPCKVGFIDKSGRFAIEPVYESARDFHEGMAAVRKDGLWGFIDTTGVMVIAAQFEQAQSFSGGYAAVKVDGRWGFLDRAGAVVIAPKFDEVGPFSDSLAVVRKGMSRLYIDSLGRVAISGDFVEMTSFVNGLAAVRVSKTRVRYIDKSGKTVFAYDWKPQ